MTVRMPTHEEMDCVFMMGFDAWGEELSESAYLMGCRNSLKYQKGQWFVLAIDDEIVSSLITYRDEFGLPLKCFGIGSVATAPEFRKRGHASGLVNEVVKNFERSGARAVYLFSDIGTSFYEKLGFAHVGGRANSTSHCMIRIINNSSTLTEEPPSYF